MATPTQTADGTERLLTPGEVATPVPRRPQDGHPLGVGRPHRLDPHPGRSPPVPRVRGPQHAREPHQRGHAAPALPR